MYILLGLLNHEEQSGYDIKKRIDLMISRFWDVGYGQIYPTLARLVQEGLVTKRIAGEGESKGPEKHIYAITESGKEALLVWLKTESQKEYTRYEILVKLFFGSSLPAENNLRLIEEFRSKQVENVQMMSGFKGNLERVLEEDEDHFYFYLTLLFGERIYNAYLDWADEAAGLMKQRMEKAAASTEDGHGNSRGGMAP
jgi:DNA-binding PadR family transcriptional regulator